LARSGAGTARPAAGDRLSRGGNQDDVTYIGVAAFRRGLGEQGYLEGRNVEILYRYGEYQLLPRLVGWFTKDVAIPPSSLGRG
jgi:hypothetical protein